jgi:hypothetical protein
MGVGNVLHLTRLLGCPCRDILAFVNAQIEVLAEIERELSNLLKGSGLRQGGRINLTLRRVERRSTAHEPSRGNS